PHLPLSSYISLSTLLFFFNATSTTDIYTLSLHDALPISNCVLLIGLLTKKNFPPPSARTPKRSFSTRRTIPPAKFSRAPSSNSRSEEHTSELQSRSDLVCRLLLEKKKKKKNKKSNQ